MCEFVAALWLQNERQIKAQIYFLGAVR